MHIRAIVFTLIFSAGCASPRGDASLEERNPKQDAHELMAAGAYDQAIAILLPLSTGGPKDAQVHSMLAEAYWKTGARDQAVVSFENALRLDHTDAVTHRSFGQMLMEMGRVGRALTEFQLAVEHGPKDALSCYNYGLALYEFGRTDEALGQWEAAASLDPANATFAEALGIGYTGRDDTAALGHFETARALGADTPSFHNNYGLLLVRLGRFEEAAGEFNEASRADPANDAFRLNLAVARLNAKDYASAAPLLEELLARSGDDRTYRIYLARAYYEQARFADAVEVLEAWLPSAESAGGGSENRDSRAGPSQPGLDEAYDTLAMSYRGLKRLREAVACGAKAVELAPANVGHLNNYGVILAESGRIDEARAQWRKVLRLEPGNTVAKQNLSAVGE
jgi:tetratricopeptide (TPR) repeat protein